MAANLVCVNQPSAGLRTANCVQPKLAVNPMNVNEQDPKSIHATQHATQPPTAGPQTANAAQNPANENQSTAGPGTPKMAVNPVNVNQPTAGPHAT
eukprot:scaffold216870_cov17-Tisochrysis_lutea.AAC.1